MRLLRLFFGVLGSVLGVGALAMVLLHFAMPEEEKVVYEIFHLPSSPLEIFAASAEPEKEQSQDEMLLQEALEQNQEVYLAECESQDTVTLLFAGDILMDDHYAVMSTYHNRGNDINQAFDQGLLMNLPSPAEVRLPSTSSLLSAQIRVMYQCMKRWVWILCRLPIIISTIMVRYLCWIHWIRWNRQRYLMLEPEEICRKP